MPGSRVWNAVIILAKHGASLGACAARYWMSDSASTTGAALAFYSAFSLAPLLIILVTISGWFVGAVTAYEDVYAQLAYLFGPSAARTLVDAAKASQQTQGWLATAVSVITLLIGATSVWAAIEAALQQVWQSAALARSGVMGWLRTRFLSFGFILALGFILLISLTISTALANVRAHILQRHTPLIGIIGALDLIISLLLVSALFAFMFRYMPARRLPWRVVIIGGVLTAILFDIGRWGIGLYLAHSTQPSAFGAAASFVALLLWLYYTAQIFLFGAEFTACLGGLRQEQQRQPAAHRSGLKFGLASK